MAQPGEAVAGGIAGAFETRLGRVLLVLSLAGLLVMGGLMLLYTLWPLTPTGTRGSVAPNDFSAFWAAGRMGLEAGPLATLDPARLAEAQLYAEPGSHAFPFLYPPIWLALTVPIGALPYAVAYPLFVVLGIAAFAVAGALTAPRQAATTRRWTAALLAGGALMLFAQVYSGQLTLIWTAALVTALALHDRGHPVAAGLMIGLCSIKPPLCLLLPIAVIATGDRRFVAAATASVTLLAVVPTLWTGIGYWQDWIAALATQSDRVGNDVTSIRGMLSWYAVLRGLGLDQPAAVGLHALVTLGAAVAVWTVWRRPGVPFAARAGLLLIAVPLASPYAWYYELAIVLAGMLFLIGAGWGRGPIAWVLFVIVWALGGFLPFLAHPVEFRYIMAPAVTLAFLAALSQTGMLGRRVERVLG